MRSEWQAFRFAFRRMDKANTDQIVVGPSDPEQRLDLFLAAKVDRLSRTRIQALIQLGHILLNGTTCRARQIIRTGDKITISEAEPEPVDLQSEDIALSILFEDEHLLVVDKPAGMTVHPAAGVQSGTLVNALLHHAKNLSGIGGELRPGVVHRLDKETSGCLVVAKHDLAHLRLSGQFAGRKVQKFYLALCAGKFAVSCRRYRKTDRPSPRSPSENGCCRTRATGSDKVRSHPGNERLDSRTLPNLHGKNAPNPGPSSFDRSSHRW